MNSKLTMSKRNNFLMIFPPIIIGVKIFAEPTLQFNSHQMYLDKFPSRALIILTIN